MAHERLLRSDCARCQGLCCVSLAFDRSEQFSFDKAADQPCRHLEPTHRCSLHRDLHGAGHAGCASYDCYGAGQRITQTLFAGVSWRDDAQRARAMFAAFRRLRDVHELLLLLDGTRRFALPAAQVQQRERLWAALEPAAGLSATSLAALDVPALDQAVRDYLRGLRAHLPNEARARRHLPLVR